MAGVHQVFNTGGASGDGCVPAAATGGSITRKRGAE